MWTPLALASAIAAAGCAAQRMDAPVFARLADESSIAPEDASTGADDAALPTPHKDCRVMNGIAICR